MRRIYITTGDSDGIGLEVAAKALFKLGPQPQLQFVVFRSSYKSSKWTKLLDQKFKRSTFSQLNQIGKKFNSINSNTLIDICSSAEAPFWFKECVHECMENPEDALVTGPISKPLFINSGLKVMGHTGLLKRITKNKDLFMAFKGSCFNVLLVTDHIPLKKVADRLNFELLHKSFLAAKAFRSQLLPPHNKKPIAILGLNPHASDSGLIGNEEFDLIKPFVKKQQSSRQSLVGPLVPDAAFMKENWSKYSLFVCLYHDQGLIPFKIIHGQETGIHITLGLPFTRVSVDHGTAKDIFNKNIANSSSMLEAIKYAINTIKR
ncbi:MAG: 4-hydroxythreonine-4-phosphate dehydrogenase PdxA [Bdellovibrionaceae bacterium]|nr:4-hydroxythreonine-4-phosphate dehydrogenase PdxA [Pseudobdellovibrionaceae bacterium]